MKHRATILLAVVALFVTASADAGLWQDIYRGLDIAATPLGGPIQRTGDGTAVNGARSGRVRIVPNGVLGDGYRLEFDRSFGVDSRGRPETLPLGAIGDVTLSGSSQMTAGFNRTGKLWFGEMSSALNNLDYEIRTKVGVQDAVLTGRLNVASALEINSLGFYDLTLNMSNTNSQVELDGVLVRNEEDKNFDVGPVVISGNVFYDMFLGVLGAAGVDITDAASITPQSPITAIVDGWRSDFQTLASESTTSATDPTLLARAVLGHDEQAAQELVAGLVADSTRVDVTDVSVSVNPGPVMPEPGTVVLLALGGLTFARTRRGR